MNVETCRRSQMSYLQDQAPEHDEQNIPSERIGGADCYQIEPEDRYLIRSFMLGIHAIYPTGHRYTPRVSALRNGSELYISLIPIGKNKPRFLLQVIGLEGTLSLQGVKTESITKFQSHFKKYLMDWRKGKIQSRSLFNNHCPNSTGIYSTFHARSYDELLQFLTYTSHHMAYC
ncbi:MAG: hypothetical protein LUQ50_10465 [Methanospirillum sp.]|uniref:hypothetical protein n=1 Tax=Methanospirillum sp. TaxID=45200 RepID=UPI00237552A7|nr:hypothetical protein [Methanospirillum sp.]MDD1729480.1 hypothetical protein [Methanospirillum sp.]